MSAATDQKNKSIMGSIIIKVLLSVKLQGLISFMLVIITCRRLSFRNMGYNLMKEYLFGTLAKAELLLTCIHTSLSINSIVKICSLRLCHYYFRLCLRLWPKS